jgi:3D (Asp-Asp-Asp) domain-containing protein
MPPVWLHSTSSDPFQPYSQSNLHGSILRKMSRALAYCAGLLLFLYSGLPVFAGQPIEGLYTATAYAQRGVTASGEYTHRHVVAADPALLPLGTRIKVTRAGRYSGEYVVADTGGKIQGRRLDIYLPSEAACRKFGRRRVRVRVLQLGDGTHTAAKEADHAVKEDVSKDVQKNVVGNAATEDDWAAKHRSESKAAGSEPTAPADGSSNTTAPNPK